MWALRGPQDSSSEFLGILFSLIHVQRKGLGDTGKAAAATEVVWDVREQEEGTCKIVS